MKHINPPHDPQGGFLGAVEAVIGKYTDSVMIDRTEAPQDTFFWLKLEADLKTAKALRPELTKKIDELIGDLDDL